MALFLSNILEPHKYVLCAWSYVCIEFRPNWFFFLGFSIPFKMRGERKKGKQEERKDRRTFKGDQNKYQTGHKGMNYFDDILNRGPNGGDWIKSKYYNLLNDFILTSSLSSRREWTIINAFENMRKLKLLTISRYTWTGFDSISIPIESKRFHRFYIISSCYFVHTSSWGMNGTVCVTV